MSIDKAQAFGIERKRRDERIIKKVSFFMT
jgi:hypothetical protein